MKLMGRTIAVAGALAVLIILSTCDLPPSFGDEYFDSSINYIRFLPLAAPTPTTDSLGNTNPETTGAWDWAWRGIMDNDFEYMKLELQDPLLEPGPSGTGVVWRLELENLFRNGTFETALAPGDVTATDTIASVAIEEAVANPIHGDGLRIESIADTGLISLYMPALLDDIQDIPDDNYEYLIRFLISPAVQFAFTAGSTNSLASPDNNGSLFINDSISGFGTGSFSFGPSIFNPTLIDEFRVIRGDKKDSMYLRLLLLPRETSPTLVPGYYEFSLWVKKPADSYLFDDHTNRNTAFDAPYALSTVTLGIRQLDWYDAPGGGADIFFVTDEWQQVRYRLPETSNIQRFNEASNEAVIELYIIPGNNAVPDAGAILISSPSLNFHINN